MSLTPGSGVRKQDGSNVIGSYCLFLYSDILYSALKDTVSRDGG
jgi:hypothetical protein